MIIGLHHAQITIPRDAEAAAREFYCGVLQFVEIPKPENLIPRGGFWMRGGTLDVHVGVENNVDRSATKAHLAYFVSDLDYWRGRLTRVGVELLEGLPIPGFDRFEFRDPFGNRVEMIAVLVGAESRTGSDS